MFTEDAKPPRIETLREGSALTGKVLIGERVSAVTHPGVKGKVDCSTMTGKELSEILVAYKDSPGRIIHIKDEGLCPIGMTMQRDDPLALITQLKELADKGVISQEEFEKKKAELLERL